MQAIGGFTLSPGTQYLLPKLHVEHSQMPPTLVYLAAPMGLGTTANLHSTGCALCSVLLTSSHLLLCLVCFVLGALCDVSSLPPTPVSDRAVVFVDLQA